MKTILISIKPKYTKQILNGEKTIEVRKSAPKELPFKVYIYCTKGRSNSRLYKEANAGGYFLDREGWRGGDYEKRYLSGKVVAEYVVNKIDTIINNGSSFDIKGEDQRYTNTIANQSCLQFPDLRDYLKGKNGYAWHISDLKIYNKPKELEEFRTPKNCCECSVSDCYYCDSKPITKPPQNFVYCEDLRGAGMTLKENNKE